MHKPILFIAFSFFTFTFCCAQVIASVEVSFGTNTAGLQIPTSIELDNITFLPGDSISLVQVDGNKKIPTPFQVLNGEKRILSWLSQQKDANQKKQLFQILKSTAPVFAQVSVTKNDSSVLIHSGKVNLLNYFYTTNYPPAGKDSAYGKSGFIHPLWAPHGQELTRIQAPDHYHHYGIWNPWTHTLFEKDTVDFWNIGAKKGTVRFAKMNYMLSGPVFAEFEALQEHVAFKKGAPEKIALNELQNVRVYTPEKNSDYYIVDVTSTLSCASESPLLIVAYRYGGFSWRTTEFWNNDNCEVLTSEGKTRKDTDGSKAKWIMVQGALPGNDSGGAIMMSYPGNFNHPEPLRIWNLNTNGRGDMFANFAPTKDKDWLLEPGKIYVLKYRMLVFNGKFNAVKAESGWQYFARPPVTKIIY